MNIYECVSVCGGVWSEVMWWDDGGPRTRRMEKFIYENQFTWNK